MPDRLSAVTVQQIEHALLDAGPRPSARLIKQLAKDYDTTTQTINRHKRRVQAGQPVQPRSGGPRRIITKRMEQAMMMVLDKEPWWYQDELADFLLDVYDIEVNQSTISRALKRIDVTRKRLKVVAAQRNEELRSHWLYLLQDFEASQLVCVDESGSDERRSDRHYGYAERGVKAQVQRFLQKRERVSVLPAYTIDGYIAALTFKGTCTGELFEDFIVEHVLPKCTPYPGPRSVIIMDNASIHYSQIERLEETARRHGVWIRFLPPYSPDFNPIEESFCDLKAYIRRHYRRKKHEFNDYQSFLEWAVRKVGTGTDACRRARAHFRNAGIQGVPEN